jgi:uncharacterized protein YlxP (DUF503 family)
MEHQDLWQEAILACALISNSNGHTQRSLRKILSWVEKNWRDVLVVDEKLEII